MTLPAVLQHEHLQQQVEVRSQLVRVAVCHLPQEFAEDGRREDGVLPTAELKDTKRIVRVVAIFP